MTVALIVAAVVVVVVVLVVVVRRRRPDPVDSFRRQIDALSPEARRPTIDQVRAADEEAGADGRGHDVEGREQGGEPTGDDGPAPG